MDQIIQNNLRYLFIVIILYVTYYYFWIIPYIFTIFLIFTMILSFHLINRMSKMDQVQQDRVFVNVKLLIFTAVNLRLVNWVVLSDLYQQFI